MLRKNVSDEKWDVRNIGKNLIILRERDTEEKCLR
jgi:hypothetical protein